MKQGDPERRAAWAVGEGTIAERSLARARNRAITQLTPDQIQNKIKDLQSLYWTEEKDQALEDIIILLYPYVWENEGVDLALTDLLKLFIKNEIEKYGSSKQAAVLNVGKMLEWFEKKTEDLKERRKRERLDTASIRMTMTSIPEEEALRDARLDNANNADNTIAEIKFNLDQNLEELSA